MPKIYIAGPVTGRKPEDVVYDFTAAEQRLRNAGYGVVNPITVVNDCNADWHYAMKKCIAALVFCDGLLLLPGWENSKGVALELHIAKGLGIEIIESL
jgi:hypothetical protein